MSVIPALTCTSVLKFSSNCSSSSSPSFHQHHIDRHFCTRNICYYTIITSFSLVDSWLFCIFEVSNDDTSSLPSQLSTMITQYRPMFDEMVQNMGLGNTYTDYHGNPFMFIIAQIALIFILSRVLPRKNAPFMFTIPLYQFLNRATCQFHRRTTIVFKPRTDWLEAICGFMSNFLLSSSAFWYIWKNRSTLTKIQFLNVFCLGTFQFLHAASHAFGLIIALHYFYRTGNRTKVVTLRIPLHDVRSSSTITCKLISDIHFFRNFELPRQKWRYEWTVVAGWLVADFGEG